MSVYQRKGVFYVAYYPNGRYGKKVRYRLPDNITSEFEAREIEQGMRAMAKADKATPSDDFSGLTIQEIFNRYLLYIEANRAKTTYVDVEISLRHLAPTIGSLRLEQLNEGYINLFKRKRAMQGVCNRTINKELSWLSGCLSFCKDRGIQVPQIRLEKLSHSRPIPIILSPVEVQAIFDQAPPFYRALFGLLYFCGMRKSEACNARWEEMDYDRHMILVPKGKGSRPRVLPLPNVEINYLNEIRNGANEGYIFISPRTGRPIREIRGAVKRYALAAGIKKNCYAHLFRHSVASHMLNHGANLRTIQSFLGHREIGTTEWYTHLSLDNLMLASNQVANFYSELPKSILPLK